MRMSLKMVMPMQTLKIGSKGSAVKTLQTLLNASTQIDVTLKVDGGFGAKTKAAVKLFQTANKLESDGVVGPITWAKLHGQETPVSGKPVDYKQYDTRWGKKLYTSTGNKSQTMANSACGPTSMADVIATFFDTNVTPYTLAQLAVKKGFRTRNSGTSWDFFKFIATQYEFSAFKKTSDHAVFLDALSKGALVVCSMGPNFWTKAGHFICAYKYENGYIYANDPASSIRKKQKWSEFKGDRKQYFIFYPPIGWGDSPEDDEPVVEPVPETPVEPTPLPYSGPTGIFDISKWQGSVNWGKVKASGKVGLMIPRAGYGQSTKDTRFDEYMAGLKKYEIPYGAYWFSYATSISGAENEMASFYKIASPHNPKVYVLDAEDRRVDGSYINAAAKKLRSLVGDAKIGLYVANHLFAQYVKEGMDTSLWDFIWIPRYSDTPPSHRPCDLWQYGGSWIAGFSGNIDSNKIPESGRFSIEWFLAK